MYLNVWVGNLGKYNEGELVGKWFELPVDDIEAELATIGVTDEPDDEGNLYEEYHICDYDTDIEGVKVGRYDSLEKLNEMAKKLAGIEAFKQEDIFQAILEDVGSFASALEVYENERYNYLGNIDCYSYGYEMLESIIDKETFKTIENWFDFKSYGADLLEDYTETSHGYVYTY